MAALVARLAAQDVSYSQPAWVYHDDPPDQYPTLRHPRPPDFPEAMLKTPNIGYVAEEVFVDDRGEVLSAELHGSTPAFASELFPVESQGAWSRRFNPAMRAGKPVNSRIHYAVLFNPASAAASAPDSTPRLLDAWPVVDPERKSKDDYGAIAQDVVWATVTIDEKGQPEGVKDAPAPVAALLGQALKAWKFAPARRAGHAVTQDVSVPFIVIAANHRIAKNKIPPRVVRQVDPTYPRSMRWSKMRGEVLVAFAVDIEGRVRSPFVVRSLNPAFDAPAIEAVSSWRFEPGREDGVPAYMKMEVPIIFNLSGYDDGGGDGITVRQAADKSGLPAEWQVDVPPRARGTVMPVYPYEMLKSHTKGSSRITYVVNEQGQVANSQVVKADRPEFGLALQAAVERFEYEPAIKNGQPNKALLGFEMDFGFSDPRVVTDADYALLRLEQKDPERIGKAADLDSPIKPVVTRAPIFPRSLVGKATSGNAVVDLLVDEAGHPHLERVVSASEPAFGYSAVQAAALWIFAPPMSKGKAVVTRVRIPFAFKAAAPEAAKSQQS
ncbi:MAG: TonB family protein [Opitutaceae bacterium]|jgi:TonB family protein